MKILQSTPRLLRLGQTNWLSWRKQLLSLLFILLLLMLRKADAFDKLICYRATGNCLVASRHGLIFDHSENVSINSIKKVEVITTFSNTSQIKLITTGEDIIVGATISSPESYSQQKEVADKLSEFLANKNIPSFEINEKEDWLSSGSSYLLFLMPIFAFWRITRTEVSFIRSIGKFKLQIYHVWRNWSYFTDREELWKLEEIKDVRVEKGLIYITLENSWEIALSDDPDPNQDRLEKVAAEIRSFLSKDEDVPIDR